MSVAKRKPRERPAARTYAQPIRNANAGILRKVPGRAQLPNSAHTARSGQAP
jgi:hypothetical protein